MTSKTDDLAWLSETLLSVQVAEQHMAQLKQVGSPSRLSVVRMHARSVRRVHTCRCHARIQTYPCALNRPVYRFIGVHFTASARRCFLSRSQNNDAIEAVSQIVTGFMAVPRNHTFRENVLILRHGSRLDTN